MQSVLCSSTSAISWREFFFQDMDYGLTCLMIVYGALSVAR